MISFKNGNRKCRHFTDDLFSFYLFLTADNSAPLSPVMEGFNSPHDPSPLGCGDQQMMPSPQDNSMANSPSSDGHVSLAHSMLRDMSTSSMDVNLGAPTSPVTNSNNALNSVPQVAPVGGGAGGSMCNEGVMYATAPPQQQAVNPNGLMNVLAMGGGNGGEGKKYQQQVTVNNNNNNNNSYVVNNNNNNQGPVEFVGHHSPQMMVPQHPHPQVVAGGGYNNNNIYGQVPSPRNERSSPPSAVPLSNNNDNNNNGNIHKISVKCASELIHGDLSAGLRTSFKKEPEHRY